MVQGITGKEARFWAGHMLRSGTNIVAGVTPGRGGQEVEGIPVYDSMRDAVSENEIDTSVVFVPAPFCKDAVFEALDAGIRKAVVLADGIPVHDSMEIRKLALSMGAIVTGGHPAGSITMGEAMLGFIPYWLSHVYRPGHIGMMTRSGSLTNEAASQVVRGGFGFSSIIGIGGDPVPCTRFSELLPLFQDDPDTHSVVMVGEVGGTMEEEVAQLVSQGHFTKPLVAFIAGRTALPGKRMGHAGAIITAQKGTVKVKIEALKRAGCYVAGRISLIKPILQDIFEMDRKHHSKTER